MTGFGFDLNRELASMRGSANTPSPEIREEPTQLKEPVNEAPIHLPQGNGGEPSVPDNSESPAQSPLREPVIPSVVLKEPVATEPITTTSYADDSGLEVKQSYEENLGGSEGLTEKVYSQMINWKKFITLPGVFEHVGGDRPVVLHPNIKRVQVSGLPEPMVSVIQERLKKRHLGAVIDFPWGTYRIEATNKVFTTKTSLIRYFLFDSLRDEEGTHVQYARQWFALQYPTGFYPDFKPKSMNPSSDELDIYALLAVAQSSEPQRSTVGNRHNGLDVEAMERLQMLSTNVDRVLSKLTEQDQMMKKNSDHNNMIQTIMLLDRMGLLKGGIPRDMGEFIRVLEQNREVINQTTSSVTNHMEAEQERNKTLMREERMRQFQNRNR